MFQKGFDCSFCLMQHCSGTRFHLIPSVLYILQNEKVWLSAGMGGSEDLQPGRFMSSNELPINHDILGICLEWFTAVKPAHVLMCKSTE